MFLLVPQLVLSVCFITQPLTQSSPDPFRRPCPESLLRHPSFLRPGFLPWSSLPSTSRLLLPFGTPATGFFGFLLPLIPDSLLGQVLSEAMLISGCVGLIIHTACGTQAEPVHPGRSSLTYLVPSKKGSIWFAVSSWVYNRIITPRKSSPVWLAYREREIKLHLFVLVRQICRALNSAPPELLHACQFGGSSQGWENKTVERLAFLRASGTPLY